MNTDSKNNLDNLLLGVAGQLLKREDLGKGYQDNPECLKCDYRKTFSDKCYSCDKISWNALCDEEGAW